MIARLTRCACVVALVFVGVVHPGARQAVPATGAPQLPARYTAPIELSPAALGTFTRPISSTNREAQAFFDQGFQLMYAFAKVYAVQSFRESWQRDPNCAICYWGEAWAWGSYINGLMTTEESVGAYAAIQKALSLKQYATPKERDFIDALAVRYVKDFDPAKRLDQDRPYAEAARQLAEKYPDDLDAATLYADALFVMEPRRGTRDLNAPNVQRLHAALEKILAVDIRHPGACHLYVHATESTIAPAKAEPCAEFLKRSIPGASHINHMPSHTWNEVGRWGDSVRANIEAWQSDQKAAIGQGFAIYPDHNLHMLLYAAAYDGQGAIAIQAGRDYAKLNGNTMYHVLTLVRFGRFDEVAAVNDRPSGDIPGGFWDFAQGYARLRTGEADAAKTYLDSVMKVAETSIELFRVNPAKNVLGTAAGILQGEILRAAGDLPGAIAAFERAVALEDALPYDEPEPLPFAARHWLGAALLEAGRHADAERVYREELEDHPHTGWSLLGLQQALMARGISSPEVDKDLEASWSRSEVWIRSSRF